MALSVVGREQVNLKTRLRQSTSLYITRSSHPKAGTTPSVAFKKGLATKPKKKEPEIKKAT